MERQRRDTEEENNLWANPCDYGSQDKPNYSSDAKKIAWNLATQARNTFTKTESYKETFAKLHSYPTFDDLLQQWDSYEYLRKEWLPKEKVLNQTMPEEYIEKFVKGDTFDTMLPGMYKGLKMIVAGLHKLHEDLNSNKLIPDESLTNNINKTMHDVRAVLCYFNDIMNLRNLKIEKLLDSEIPSISNDMGFVLYRDTLRYLEYLEQVFLAFHEKA